MGNYFELLLPATPVEFDPLQGGTIVVSTLESAVIQATYDFYSNTTDPKASIVTSFSRVPDFVCLAPIGARDDR